MGAVRQDLHVIQGKTFNAEFGWAQGRFVWRAISGVAQSAPLQITVAGHDIRDGWPYWISDLRKPACLNNVENGCQGDDDVLGDPYLAEVVDADTLSINHINGMRLDPYSGSGGVIRYYEREDITGFQAKMQVRRSARDGQILYEASSTGTAPALALDTDKSTFLLSIPADALDEATFCEASYEIEIESPTGEKFQLAYGAFVLERDAVR